MTPPTARIDMVSDTYFGTTVADPYRWLEDWEGAEARAWLDAQAACARAFLDALPERAALLAHIAVLDAAVPALSDLRLSRGRTFYMHGNKLIVRAAPEAEEWVLLDPGGMASAEPVAVTWYAPSPNGRLVAYGLVPGGSMESTLHVLDVEGGHTLDLAISRASPTVMWLDDNRSFLYHRFTATSRDAPPAERFRNNRTYLHRPGRDPEDDRTVFARGLPGVEIDKMSIPLVHTAPGSGWLVGEVLHGVTRRSLYVAPSRQLDESGPCRWTKVVDVDDMVHGFALGGDTLYLLMDKEAPRRKVLALSLHDPDLAHATELVPQSQVVIEEIRVAGAYLLTRELDGGIMRLRRVARDTGESRAVALPIEGTVMQWASEATHPVVLLQLTGWTMPPRMYRYDAGRDTVEDTAWWAPPPVDTGNLEAHDVHVSSHDGTQVPLSIIHKKGLARDGTNPTLLQGYGSHGIALTPTFSAPMLAWYERGGILAVAHVRGGGEYGAPWHEAGRKLNKQKGVDDFIACAEYLIARGYTRPGCLAGEGRSAGGILVGNALVQRPDLWAAVILEVPVVNALRFEVTQAGVGNVGEFGSIATEEGFRALYQMDAYIQVRDGVTYPAVLLTTGLKDPSTVGQAAKMAARLQAATTSGKPVLLRVEVQGRHGFSSPELLADKLAFLLSQCG